MLLEVEINSGDNNYLAKIELHQPQSSK